MALTPWLVTMYTIFGKPVHLYVRLKVRQAFTLGPKRCNQKMNVPFVSRRYARYR